MVVKDKVRSIIELPKKEEEGEEGLPPPSPLPKSIMNKNCLDENKQTSKQAMGSMVWGRGGEGRGGGGGVLATNWDLYLFPTVC